MTEDEHGSRKSLGRPIRNRFENGEDLVVAVAQVRQDVVTVQAERW